MVIRKSLVLIMMVASSSGWGQAPVQDQTVTNMTKKVTTKSSKKSNTKKSQKEVPVPLAPVATALPHYRLSQKKAAELILLQGAKTQELSLSYELNRYALAKTLSSYDWNLSFETGYENDKTQAFSPSTIADSKYERFRTTSTLQKELTTGTLLGLEYNRLSQNADVVYPAGTTVIPPNKQVQDSFGLTLQQDLWANSFGRADRATVNSAENSLQATELLRSDDLENLVLVTIRQYWDTYVAQENLSAALSSREKYKKLLEVVKRKNGSGYANPGELTQTQAEYETREQNVKSASTDFLQKLESLLTVLGLDPKTEIDFEVPEALPSLPKLPEINKDELRSLKSQKLKLQAAQDSYLASQSKSHPYLSLVGKAYATGSDQTSEASTAAAISGNHPKYYVGLKLVYAFGSDLQTEDIINKKALKEIEESKLHRLALETNDTLMQAERKVQSSFAIAESAFKLKDYRDKAVQELNRTYSQGRTDIKTLIDAMNNFFAADVQLSRAIGDYQISLNELAAARDELIADNKKEKNL